ncbi:unnamed protein product [Ranitomeya imitator]|uniref:Replication termination factor 2 n=1 Tax=Ranitomeya imitator TaxID=111125 RepID=A0ABN9MBY1_9NEOB|nr:unnamed protein product [Ranitomeya imitator]
MGCDGGTIPKRHELVKGPKKVEKIDKNAELVARWYYCTLSQEKLKRPIVTCELGRLYNKDAVIEFLLDKSTDKPHADSAAHIKSIKNVIELNLSDNPAWTGDKGNTKGDKYDDQRAQFICPVVGLEMNGKYRFCVLRQCGCVFSERALKEIKTDICHKMETHREDSMDRKRKTCLDYRLYDSAERQGFQKQVDRVGGMILRAPPSSGAADRQPEVIQRSPCWDTVVETPTVRVPGATSSGVRLGSGETVPRYEALLSLQGKR